ncbi:MAG: hypothetical protein K8U03_01755 [Planctomycetia bacterium]|nr:hypothetical protein [Planctomycetia bacterium]
MTFTRLLFAALCCFALSGCNERDSKTPRGDYEPRVGDILFQSLPHNALVDAIEGASKSPYSHCGIVADKGGAWVVIEATGPVVVETRLDPWIYNGRGNRFAVYRFDEKYSPKIDAVVQAARKQLGKPYDIHYEFDDEKIYCSELIFKAFRDVTGEELGTIRKLGELDWKPHEAVIRQIERGGLPLERPMITPHDVSIAKQLQLHYRKGL